jgi:uncharacterized membrane protein
MGEPLLESQMWAVDQLQKSYVLGKIRCAWIFVYRPAFGRLWPLTLATLIYVPPIIYMYLTFQCHWHECGVLINVINNLFERGEFYYYDWNMDYLNNHFTPFFYVLSPLVHFTRSLFFLLLLCALAFATSAWLYYKFTQEILGSSSLAALCYLTFVTNPYLMVANLYPHYEVFMVLTLMGFALLAVSGNYWLALLCLMIAVSVKEDVWIYGIAASLILLGRISTRHAALYLGTAVGYYVVVLHFLYPIWYPDGVNLKYFLQIWAYGHSQGEVLQYLITHPWDTGKHLISGSGLDFNLSYLFLPVLAGWRFLMGLAVLYLWVNSTDIYHSSLAFYFNLPCIVLYALMLPFALINLERLWGRLRSRFPQMIPARIAAQTALCAIVAVGIVWQVRPPQTLIRSPTLPDVFAHELRIHQFIQIHRALNSILADPHTSVLASFTIGAYVPPRGKLFIMHIDANNVMNGPLRPDFVVFDLRQSQPYFGEEAVRYFFAYLQASPEYHMVADIHNVIIFAKR